MGAGLRGRKTPTQAHVQKLPSLSNTSWDKRAVLLKNTINVLFGKTYCKYDSMFCFAVTMPR